MKSELTKAYIFAILQRLVLAAGLTSSMSLAMAEETKIYKWRDANGRTSYSQNPPPKGTQGATSIVVETTTFTPAQRAAIKAHLAKIDAAQQAESVRFRSQIAAADESVSRALESLTYAERVAHDGRTPKAGDRIGNAGGGSRLRSEYFDRQKQLEDAIQEAKVRVDQAYRRRAQIMP